MIPPRLQDLIIRNLQNSIVCKVLENLLRNLEVTDSQKFISRYNTSLFKKDISSHIQPMLRQ